MNALLRFLLLLVLVVTPAYAEEKPINLDPVEVNQNPFGSMGIGARARTPFLAWLNRDAKIKSLVISVVTPGSPASERGSRWATKW